MGVGGGVGGGAEGTNVFNVAASLNEGRPKSLRRRAAGGGSAAAVSQPG